MEGHKPGVSEEKGQRDKKLEDIQIELWMLENKVERLLKESSENEDTVEPTQVVSHSPPKTELQQKRKKSAGEESKEPKKNGWIGEVLFYVVLVLLVLSVAVIKINGSGSPVSFAGYTAQIVLTGSMEEVIPKGSLVISKRVDPASLQIGDDIIYMANQTTTVTHRIVGITEKYENTGQRAFQTQGVMNDEPDKLPVPAANVVGKVVFYSPALGQIANFVSKNWPFLLFLILLLAAFVKVMQRILRKDSEST